MFYHTREDPWYFFPRRTGLGWTINFAHPVAIVMLWFDDGRRGEFRRDDDGIGRLMSHRGGSPARNCADADGIQIALLSVSKFRISHTS